MSAATIERETPAHLESWSYNAELACGHALEGAFAEQVYAEGYGAIVDCPQHGETIVTHAVRKNW